MCLQSDIPSRRQQGETPVPSRENVAIRDRIRFVVHSKGLEDKALSGWHAMISQRKESEVCKSEGQEVITRVREGQLDTPCCTLISQIIAIRASVYQYLVIIKTTPTRWLHQGSWPLWRGAIRPRISDRPALWRGNPCALRIQFLQPPSCLSQPRQKGVRPLQPRVLQRMPARR
jgi:hypothetical protein